jgi:hypothetical protein
MAFVKNRAGIIWNLPDKEAQYRVEKDGFTFVEPETPKAPEAPKEEIIEEKPLNTGQTNADLSIEEIREQYVEATGKKVPPKFIHNKEWLLSKIYG